MTLGYDGANRHITSGPAVKQALFVVGNKTAPNAADVKVRDWLTGRGWTVTLADDDGFTATQAAGHRPPRRSSTARATPALQSFATSAASFPGQEWGVKRRPRLVRPRED